MNTPRILTLCLLMVTYAHCASTSEPLAKLKYNATTLLQACPTLLDKPEFHPLAKIAFDTDDHTKLIEQGHIPAPTPWHVSRTPNFWLLQQQ